MEKIKNVIPNTTYIKEVGTKFLCQLFDFQTPTGNKKQQFAYLDWIVKNFIEKNNIDCIIERDEYGGMYITKGNANIYPCVISHIDTVHYYDKHMKSYVCGDYIIAMSEGEQCGLGADPKNGVYILLQLLLHFDNIKCVLFLDEEQGGKNSNVANMTFFEDCSFVMQFDRRSYTTDVIEHSNGIQVLSEEFKKMIFPSMKEYGYSFNDGTFTDVGVLTNKGIGINTFNVSNGSFNEHYENETCGINHLLNALNFGIDIIQNYGDVRYEFLPKKEFANKMYSYDKWEEHVFDNSECECCIENGELHYVSDFNIYMCKKCINDYVTDYVN